MAPLRTSQVPIGALLLCVAALSGCCLHPLPEPLLTDPESLLAGLASEPAKSFLAEARIDYYGEGQARKGKLTVMAAAPDRLRLDLNSFTDDLIAVLAVAERRFTWFERGRKECLTGPLCAAPILARFPFLTEPDALLDALLGRVRPLPEPESSELTFDRRLGLYRLRLRQGEVEQELRIAPDGVTVVGWELQVGGIRVLEVRYAGRIGPAGRQVPQQIRIIEPRQGADLSVDYREVELDYSFQGDPFHFKCPRGTEQHFLICEEEQLP